MRMLFIPPCLCPCRNRHNTIYAFFRSLYHVCIFLLSALPAIAQDTILIQDAHFELRNPYNPESVWQSAGLRPPFMLVAGAGETDVQPHDGNQCIALSLSGSEWAGINQLLADTFQKDTLYRFSLWLSHSNTFKSKGETFFYKKGSKG